MSLARFLILLINNNLAKCCHLILSTYVYFLTICFTANAESSLNLHSLSLPHSLSLSLRYLVLAPPFLFWYKTDWILCFDDQLNKRFSTAHCSHFKSNISTKLRKKGNMALVPGGVSSGLEVFCSRVGDRRVSAESLSTAVAGSILSSSTPNGSDSPA